MPAQAECFPSGARVVGSPAPSAASGDGAPEGFRGEPSRVGAGEGRDDADVRVVEEAAEGGGVGGGGRRDAGPPSDAPPKCRAADGGGSLGHIDFVSIGQAPEASHHPTQRMRHPPRLKVVLMGEAGKRVPR